MVTGRTKGVTDRVKGNVVLGAAQHDDGDGNPTEQYLLLRADENGRLRVETGDGVVTGRTKGLTDRAKGRVVLLAAQREDGDGNPTDEYLLLRADENGRLRTVGGAVGAVAFLALTDTPAAYTGSGGQTVQVNAGETALEFGLGGEESVKPLRNDIGGAEDWALPGWGFQAMGATAIDGTRIWYWPIFVERSTTFNKIGCRVTVLAAGKVVRMGIYEADISSGRSTPGALVLDAGTVAVGAVGEKAIAINETLARGHYWLALGSDGAPTLNTLDKTLNIQGPVSGGNSVLSGGFVTGLQVTVANGAAAFTDPATVPDGLGDYDRCYCFIGT